MLRCGSRNSLELRHLQGRYYCDLPRYSYGGGMEGLRGGSHVDCGTYWFCYTYIANSTALRHRSLPRKKTWRDIYPHFKFFPCSPSRSDDQTVAVRLQPTGTSCSSTGASRQRRLTVLAQGESVRDRRLNRHYATVVHAGRLDRGLKPPGYHHCTAMRWWRLLPLAEI